MTQDERFAALLAEAKDDRRWFWKSLLWDLGLAILLLACVGELCLLLVLVFA